jgi:hypothetical protein
LPRASSSDWIGSMRTSARSKRKPSWGHVRHRSRDRGVNGRIVGRPMSQQVDVARGAIRIGRTPSPEGRNHDEDTTVPRHRCAGRRAPAREAAAKRARNSLELPSSPRSLARLSRRAMTDALPLGLI